MVYTSTDTPHAYPQIHIIKTETRKQKWIGANAELIYFFSSDASIECGQRLQKQCVRQRIPNIVVHFDSHIDLNPNAPLS